MIGDKKNPAQKGINAAMAALEKRFGEPVLMKMVDANTSFETRSSGRADLDIILGGGYPIGKIIEIYAEEACGKTGLVLEAVKVVQDLGGVVGYFDFEHVLDRAYCEQIGVDIDALIFSQPSYAEQGFEAIRALIQTREVDLIVCDSVSAMVTKAILEGETGEAKMASLARIMAQALNQIKGIASEVGCTVIFINQLRDTLSMYGSAKAPSGGNSLKFYAAQRLEIKKKGQNKEGETVIGFKQEIKTVKNKVAPPFQTVNYDITYGLGADTFQGLVDALVFEEILTKKGAWFVYDGSNIAQGIKKLRVIFDDNPELKEELEAKLASKK